MILNTYKYKYWRYCNKIIADGNLILWRPKINFGIRKLLGGGLTPLALGEWAPPDGGVVMWGRRRMMITLLLQLIPSLYRVSVVDDLPHLFLFNVHSFR